MVSGGVPTTYMTSTFLKVKKSSSWKTLCLKRGSCLRPRPLARNRTKWILLCNNQANELQFVPNESIEPNDNDPLELNTVAYAFSKIFQPEICWNVTVTSDPEGVVFPVWFLDWVPKLYQLQEQRVNTQFSGKQMIW